MYRKTFMFFLTIYLSLLHHSYAGNDSGLPQLKFETYPSLIFWSILSLIILYILMSNIVTPKISFIINNREQNIQNNLLKAKLLKEESD